MEKKVIGNKLKKEGVKVETYPKIVSEVIHFLNL